MCVCVCVCPRIEHSAKHSALSVEMCYFITKKLLLYVACVSVRSVYWMQIQIIIYRWKKMTSECILLENALLW